MGPGDLKGGALGAGTALLASSCCLLPLLVVLLGVGSGAFMMATMPYRPLLFPAGVLGVGTGYYLHFRGRRRCREGGCALPGGRLNLALLVLATLVLAGEFYAGFILGFTVE